VREGAVCVRLRHASRSDHDPDDPLVDPRTLAAGGWDGRSDTVPAHPGETAATIGGITSSLHERGSFAAFGNNVDTCARLPLADRIRAEYTIGESAGTQAFDSVMQADAIILVGANPTRAIRCSPRSSSAVCGRAPSSS
jgi:anaerobic selenocysteine-containing dehydrogenase